MGGLKLSEIKKHVMTGISFMIPIVVGPAYVWLWELPLAGPRYQRRRVP